MPLDPTPYRLLALRTGSIRPLGPDGVVSAIDKQPVSTALVVTPLGLEGDMQADREHHGGPDKALHHYPAEHYPAWRAECPAQADLFQPGGFGENLSTLGLDEHSVCLGDIHRLGTTTLQVSQGRSPCRKLNARFGRADMPARVLASGRTGWYYRVLVPGVAAPDDSLILLERPAPAWNVARLLRALFIDPVRRRDLAELAGHPLLSDNWRERAARRLAESDLP